MSTPDTETNTNPTEATVAAPAAAPFAAAAAANPTPGLGRGGFRSGGPGRGGDRGGDRGGRGGSRGGPRREPRAKPEFDQKILEIRRVTRVASGGRRFSFSVAIVAGDKKGRVGVGTGKAGDTSLAIEKALKNAKKHMITIKTTSDMSIPHEVSAKYSSARLEIMPAKGKGLVAGSAIRIVLELAGVKDIVAKLLSPSKNQLNIAQATIKALSELKLRTSKATAAPLATATK
ncbi:MAG: 30S ribosomal protein S5 [Candidatus Pacebacteria bacterium]|nr:30S ribosomal protein S5 [Candidatus Paceibacterota bacterium]